MMQKEKHDPEKTNLLKKQERKKKKKYMSSRSKSNKSTGSIGSERCGNSYKCHQELHNAEFDPIRTHSIPFQGEKKESWWFWGDTTEKPISEDTCSCGSCALKKLINTDYACIACLVLLFSISVLVAFLLVYKSIPCLNETPGLEQKQTDRSKRRIATVNRWDEKETVEGQKLDSVGSNDGLPRSMDQTSNIQDLSGLVDSDSELFKVLEGDVMNEIQGSDHLRDFYKKLIQTDAQIQNLKKRDEMTLNDIKNFEDQYRMFPERAKRSLKQKFHKPLRLLHYNRREKDIVDETKNKNVDGNTKVDAETKDSNSKSIKPSRAKRFDNTSEPDGFLIEKKKIYIQYKPNRKSKCSHAPKDSKSHEKQLKHPFYQNTQRLDELLDMFLDKNMPDLIPNPFDFNMVYDKEKKCKHPKIHTEIIPENKPVNKNKNDQDFKHNKGINAYIQKAFKNTEKDAHEAKMSTERDIYSMLEFGAADDMKKGVGSSTNAYDLLLTVSTVMYANNDMDFKRPTYKPKLIRAPNGRKLLQAVDDANDDMNEESSAEVTISKQKSEPASILNPNWKGPMPLYPDELNLEKQEPVKVHKVDQPDEIVPAENAEENSNDPNTIETPLNKDTASEGSEFEADLNDMEYIEDYFRNKYDKLVEMAQAYSDYGVLEGRKISDKKTDEKVIVDGPDKRMKMSLSGFKQGFKNSIFGKPRKGNRDTSDYSEGIRVQIQPTTNNMDDSSSDIMKSLKKHVKLFNDEETTPDLGILTFTPKISETTTNKKCEGVIFSIGKGKRSLKSVELEDHDEVKGSVIYDPRVVDNKYEIDDDMVNLEEISHGKFDDIVRGHNLEFDTLLTQDHASTEDGQKVDVIDAKADAEKKIKQIFGLDKEANHTLTETDSKKLHTRGKREASNNTVATANTTINATTKAIESSKINETAKVKGENVHGMKFDAKSKNSIDNMNLSDFFRFLSNWFSALDGVEIHSNDSSPSAPNRTMNKLTKNTDMSYPEYDSDMIENIGHRSRVLLSVKDTNATDELELEGEQQTGNDSAAKTNISNHTATNIVNKTKSIVKRNVDDSNLIFWNDLYDDEYGVKDHLENTVRDKYSVAENFLKRPNEWFRTKIKKISDDFHKKTLSFRKGHKGNAGKDIKQQTKVKEDKMKSNVANLKRFSRNVFGNTPHKTDFAALTANMKKICKKAAKDVTLANKVDVREVGKEGQVTSTLMQQLVRLMSDLVDYQVKQRTCRKLPPDLHNFLEWLTSPDPDPNKLSSGFKAEEYAEVDFDKFNNKPEEDHALGMGLTEREDKVDTRSDCLGTLQSVRELMRQYEELADDDKSKMTGVKEYLQNQLQFLQKQITTNNDFLYNTDSIRFRRDVSNIPINKKHKKVRPNERTKLAKPKPIKKKKKVANKHHAVKEVDKTPKSKIFKNKEKGCNHIDVDTKKVNDEPNAEKDGLVMPSNDKTEIVEKRNLRDVYYKAIENAKKLATVKEQVK